MATAVVTESATVRGLIEAEEIRSVYQPIVDLATGLPVGFEALVRGPAGSPLESPGSLFAAARDEACLPELDVACVRSALRGARDAGLHGSQSLFVNVEPSALLDGEELLHVLEHEGDGVRTVFELTERALTSRPAEVLAFVKALRERGVGIALDDVGVERASLALVPFVGPDVIKVDRSLIQDAPPTLETARVFNALAAEAERSGACLLAEGIENETHLRNARAMGAKLGQGWYFGRPAEAPAGFTEPPGTRVRFRKTVGAREGTPFELVADERLLRRGDKRLLLTLSRQLEAEAASLDEEVVVLSTFQEAGFFTAKSRSRYQDMARRAALVAAIGVGMPPEPALGVRGAAIAESDELRGEWDVAVISPHFAGAFVARDLGDVVADADRRFDFFITFDRELVATAARALMSRIQPG